ncbi:MAG TPA: extracellular solute-binding protein [Alphaproteobacteria bacterium]|nr:extracellular solute-binding protein [Alphaproteobacteria bacterium]
MARYTRRKILKTAAAASAFTLAAPYVRGAYAAGTLSLGCWDHWVPGANATFTKLCNEWGEKNKVEVKIDYITSQGEKDKLTAAAEAQAGAGHDIMTHRDWNINVHRDKLVPIDDVVNGLIKQYGPISVVAEYLAKIKGNWHGVPTTVGSQVKPCCSRFDLYKEHAGLDLREIFPADEAKWDKAKVDAWTWDAYLASAEKLFKAGFPVGLPMGQSSDAVDWVSALFKSYGVVFMDEKSTIKIDSAETRQAMEMARKIMAVSPPDVYAWDDAGNNRWLISGKGAGIMNPPSAWAVAKKDNPKVAENCWTHPMPKGPKGRFVGQLPIFYGIWAFSKNQSAAKDLLTYVSQKDSARQLVAASSGYDLPSFKAFYDFDTWKTVEPPVGTVYNYPPRGDEQTSMAGYPAPPDVSAQLYNQALPTVMVSKFTQGKEKLDEVIKWAANELEGYQRT